MTPVVFQSGIPAVCQNWPGKEPHLSDFPYHTRADQYVIAKMTYDQSRAASIASAIPFVESDQQTIIRYLTGVGTINGQWGPQVDRHGIQDGTVYMISADHELGWQWLNKNALGGEEWENCTGTVYQMFERSGKYTVRHVMRLTPPDKKEAVEPDSGKEDPIKLNLLQFDETTGELINRTISNVMAEKIRLIKITNYHYFKKSDLLGSISIQNERIDKLAIDVEGCMDRVIAKAKKQTNELAKNHLARLNPPPVEREGESQEDLIEKLIELYCMTVSDPNIADDGCGGQGNGIDAVKSKFTIARKLNGEGERVKIL